MRPSTPTAAARRSVGRAALAIALAATLSGCAGTDDWSDVRTRPEPTVRAYDYQVSLGFAPGSATLTAAEQQRLARFLDEAGAEPHNQLAITPLAAVGGAAAERTAAARANAVARYLRRRGFDPAVSPARTDPSGRSGEVDVSLRRYVVSLPKCPDWTDQPGRNFNNQLPSNWGCATATNFGIMVADPADLVRGRDAGPASAERLSQSVERYRTDQVKELKVETTTEVFATPEAAERDAQALDSVAGQSN